MLELYLRMAVAKGFIFVSHLSLIFLKEEWSLFVWVIYLKYWKRSKPSVYPEKHLNGLVGIPSKFMKAESHCITEGWWSTVKNPYLLPKLSFSYTQRNLLKNMRPNCEVSAHIWSFFRRLFKVICISGIKNALGKRLVSHYPASFCTYWTFSPLYWFK